MGQMPYNHEVVWTLLLFLEQRCLREVLNTNGHAFLQRTRSLFVRLLLVLREQVFEVCLRETASETFLA